MLSADGDPARHIAVGDYVLRTMSIPRQDVFSHTMAGQPLVVYQWLGEVATALAFRVAGPAGPVLVHGAIIASTFCVVFANIRARNVRVALALVITLAAAGLSMMHWLVRPHVFTFLGLAATCAVLEAWWHGRARPRVLCLLPLAMLAWANVHGGFLIGFVVMGVYLASDLAALALTPRAGQALERLRQLLPVVAVSGVASLLNPSGGTSVAVLSQYPGLIVNRTDEYMSPNFHEAMFWPFLVVLVIVAAALAWSRRRPSLPEGSIVLVLIAASLYSARNIPLALIVLAPPLASQLSALPHVQLRGPLARFARSVHERGMQLERVETMLRAGWWSTAVALLVSTIGVVQWHDGVSAPIGVRFDPLLQPVAAVDYLAAHPPPGNGFNELVWGGYVLQRLWPSQRVFIDGQTDFYGEALLREYLDVVEVKPDWEAVLRRYGVGWALIPSGSRLGDALAAEPEWRVAYRDKTATVFERSPS
ncbi:MAG TPA: hypothetical protein VFC51_13580 [Chloroflexota bacterium]|nr:hypothetical protein [Chloroflexota bacterium]